MKKILLSSYIIFVAIALNAQVATDSVLRSKKGIPILPQKGDWAIGIDALPYLNYLGNIFNNSNNNSLHLGSQTLYGRYFISNDAAIRVLISIDQSSDLHSYYVRDDAAYVADPLSNTKTTDTYKSNYTAYTLDLGYQKFRGYGRLKGFYGAHVGFGYDKTHEYYTYGNPITVANSSPTTYWGNQSSRTLEYVYGAEKTVNLGGIAGVEYYFLPKVCIGGEITLSFSYSWRSQSYDKYEKLNNTVVQQYEEANTPAGRTNTSLFTERPANYGGSLYVMFHF
ncbi:MAG TPA: hypothetical protein VIH57_01065 [Bacteroidales bacterium]|jgi:hypothetical protein